MAEQKAGVLDDVIHFYGGSMAGRMYTVAAFNGTDYSKPACADDDQENAGCSLIHNLMLAKNYKKNLEKDPKEMNEDDVHYEFVDFLVNTALFHRELENGYISSIQPIPNLMGDEYIAMNRTNAGQEAVQEEVQGDKTNAPNKNELSTTNVGGNKIHEDIKSKVLGKWNSLNEHTKNFYKTHIEIYQGTNKVKFEEIGNWGDIQSYTIKLVRANDKTLFMTTIPLIPKGTKKLWYTDKNDRLKSLEFKENNDGKPEYELRRIYQYILSGEFELYPTKWNPKLTQDFNLDDPKFFRNYCTGNSKPPLQTPSQGSIDDWFDMVTGTKYHRNKDGKLCSKDANGYEKVHDTIPNSGENCYGTHLKGDEIKCKKFVHECLMSNDSHGLAYCMNFFQDANFFNVARDEMHKVDPVIAKKILQKFMFRQKKVNGVDVPEDFEHWKTHVVKNNKIDENAMNAITKNENLCAYLKGVISFVRDNPAILNPSMTNNNPQPIVADSHLQALKMEYYVSPPPNTPQAKEFANSSLRAYLSSPTMVLQNPIRALSSYVNSYANAIPMGSMVGVPFAHSGGYQNGYAKRVNERNPNEIKHMMSLAINELRQSGVELNQEDANKIDKAVEDLVKLEEKLLNLHHVFRVFSTLETFFNAGREVTTTKNIPVSVMKKIAEREDVINLVVKNKDELARCIENNINAQCQLSKDLANIYADLGDASLGKRNSNVVEHVPIVGGKK